MQTVLMTGGAGFLGSNLASFHSEKRDTVVILDNLITGSKDNIRHLPENVSFVEADLTITDLPAILKNQHFDIIYHLASPASPKQYFAHPVETLMVNSVGTKNLLDYMNQTKSTILVYTSTSEVYGDPVEHPQKETYWGNVNPIGPRSCYDEGKRFGEALCMAYVKQFGLHIRIARLFNTFGPHMEKEDGRVISNFIVQALEGKPLTVHGDGTQTRSFCYVDDMIEALFQLATRNVSNGEVINLGNSNEQTIINIANKIRDLTKTHSQIVFYPEDIDDPKRRKPDLSKAKKILDWEAHVSFEMGLKKTIDYFKSRFKL